MLKKFLVFLLIIVAAPLVAGIYGMLHDQLTYTISPEYYTRFKFIQFGFAEEGYSTALPNTRLWVAAVGFLATWWVGVPVGIVLGLTGLIHKESKRMLQITANAFLLAITAAFVTGLLGLLYGFILESPESSGWWLPAGLENKTSFIAVGSMHNFSYFGGLTGLIAGVYYSIRLRKKGI